MTAYPAISVVIPFYNCPYVDRAVESVLAQTYRHVELIVVDDGSTKHRELLKPYAKRIRYFRKPNGGTASALNYGIARASGDYFAWLSSDDIFVPDKLSVQMEFMLANRAFFSYTAFGYINEKGERTGGEVRCSFPTRRHMFETFMRGCPVNGSSVVMKTDLFRTIGMFNTALRYTHDYDLWLRILPHYELFYVDEPLLYYRVHDGMGTRLHREAIEKEVAAVQDKHHETLMRLLAKEG